MGRLRYSTTALLHAAIAAAVLATACSRGDAEGEPGAGPYAKQVAKAVPQIERATGLQFKTPPKVERRTRDEVRTFLVTQFEEERAQRELAGQVRAYKLFGLVPDTLDVRAFMLDLLTEQVVGYYDPATKVLYIVDGAPEEQANLTITHELVHALQDQYLNLDSLQNVEGNNDRAMAAQAIVEGQATYEHIRISLGGGNLAAQLPGGWDRVREMVRDAQTSMPVFAAAPLVLQETLIFPYLSGMEFMRRFVEQRPGATPYDSMPVSTEQVMHAPAYFGTRDEPTAITLPDVTGASYQNNLGEFETRLFLFQHLQDQALAVRGAAGWDGDRYVTFTTPRGDGLAWLSVWDSTVDSGEFFDAVDAAIRNRFAGAAPSASGSTARTYTSGGRTISVTAGEAGGRPVVLYVDVPAGTPATVLDLSRVTLQGR